MKLKTFAPALGFVFAVLVCQSLRAQGTWTSILTSTDSSSDESGVYKVFNNGYSATTGSDIASISQPLTFPLSGGNPQTVGGYDSSCSSAPSYWTPSTPPYRYPSEFLQSNYLTEIIGLEVLGTFGSGSYSSGSGDLQEAVFFGEQGCFFGGREYGFVYDPTGPFFHAYWGTNVNCSTSYCTSMPEEDDDYDLGTTYLGTEYYFEIWPVYVNSTTCHFEVEIQGPAPDYTVYYGPTATQNVSSAILTQDPNFCTSIVGYTANGNTGDSGYITNGVVYTPTLSGLSSYSLTLDEVKIGRP